MTTRRRGWLVAAVVLAGHGILHPATPETVDFGRDIRPILSEKCFTCHGPDRRRRRSGLRLDTKEGAFGDLGGYRAVVPGRPQDSELFIRITEPNEEDRMPPPKSLLKLTPREIELLRVWIEQGATWSSHWSFLPVPATVEVPTVEDTTWPENEIDHFVLHRLEDAQQTPRPRATKERLLRRVTFSLTGLPPTLDEIDAFLADESPHAYEKVVDRLLASAAYGEHLAAPWLDLARFADTYGYQSDRYNHLWPWRDWVIRTFNRDLPYDESLTWQIAGDLLPEATREQRLATAFNRNHRQTNEGGSVNEEFRVEYNADRVATTSMAFLGLTMQCARCHEHKFDPISHEEYYQFFAFFNSTDESGLYSHFTDAIPCPTLLLYRSGKEEARHQELKRLIVTKERELAAYRTRALSTPRDESAPATAAARNTEASLHGLVGDYSFDEIEGGKVPNTVNEKLPGTLSDAPRPVEGRRGRALLFDGENSVSFKGVADFTRTEPFSLSLWVKIPEVREKIIVLHHSRAGSDAGSRGYELLLENGRASFALIHFWPGNAIKVATAHPLRLDVWTHIVVTYDGSSRARGIELFVDGQRADLEIQRDHLWKSIQYSGRVPLMLGARFRGRGFRGGSIDELKVFDRCLTSLEVHALHADLPLSSVLARSGEGRSDSQTLALREYRLATFDAEYTRRLAELKALRDEENNLVNGIPEIMVMGDLPTPRPTYVLRRGAYDSHGKTVQPGTPASILPFDESLPRNRLGLAGWLVDPRNPLTARVAVNRSWQRLFGRGLVTTPEDFGSQGAPPMYPHLLDWLARRFMEQGWGIKALDKLIVLSATYRQSSVAPEDQREQDPENALLARGPSRRLSAEEIRDAALAGAGLIRSAIGGPSVQPGRPIAGTVPKKTDSDRPEERNGSFAPRNGHRYRRSLYTYIKRTAPSPYLMSFDATNRETCVARRQSTNTPLQALILLNDPLFTEACRMLGERIVTEGGSSTENRATFAFRTLAGRRPTAPELAILTKLYREQRTLFRGEPEQASRFLAGGLYRLGDSLDAAEVAAAAMLVSALLNFDETLNLR